MNTASVTNLDSHRVSRRAARPTAAESPLTAAVAAPDFGAAVTSEAEADARRASWHYPPAAPLVDWFPPARTIQSRADLGVEALRLIAIAACAAIVAGTMLAVLAGTFAVALDGADRARLFPEPPAQAASRRAAGVSGAPNGGL